MFPRLSSVSAKEATVPVISLREAREILVTSDRCQNAMRAARRHGLPILIAMRELIAIDQVNEFRCFVYEDRLRAICSHDDKLPNVSENAMVGRCQPLLEMAKHHFPFHADVVDVFLADESKSVSDCGLRYRV